MAKQLPGGPEYNYRTTDHSVEISLLRRRAAAYRHSTDRHERVESLIAECAAALLQCHDETGISLDDWPGPRELVEYAIESRLLENHI